MMLIKAIPALALAALAAPLTPALAAPAQAVQYADLDLDTAAGKATLDARIRAAARGICRDQQRTGTHLGASLCMSQVRQEVLARIEAAQDKIGKGG